MKRIEIAPSTEIARRQQSVQKLLEAIARLMVEEGESIEDWLNYCLVTDESRISDFLTEDQEIAALSTALGVSVGPRDFLYEIAMRMSKP